MEKIKHKKTTQYIEEKNCETSLIPFAYGDSLCRTVIIDGEIWFVGKDVATILGYAKTENAIATHVDDKDKTTTLIQGDGSNYKSKMVLIKESGMYALVIGSKLPDAKKFKHWVTSEVLSSLRKNGSYFMDGTKPEMSLKTDELLKNITTLNSNVKKILYGNKGYTDYERQIYNKINIISDFTGKSFNETLRDFFIKFGYVNKDIKINKLQKRYCDEHQTTYCPGVAAIATDETAAKIFDDLVNAMMNSIASERPYMEVLELNA